MNAYICVDGFTIPSTFVLKELFIQFANGEHNHLMFLPPNINLTEADRRTIRFTTKHLNNISYFDGDVPYSQLQPILHKLRDYKIYTYSEVALKTLQSYLPMTVIVNIQEFGFKMPAQLENPCCFRFHSYRYCAKAKAIAVKSFIEKQQFANFIESNNL